MVVGSWDISRDGDQLVYTHDPAKWASKEGFPLMVFGRPDDFSGGTARIDFKLIGGTDDYSAGLVFGHQGGETYYYARYNTKDGNVALWRMDGPKRTVIKHGEHHEQLPKNVWHRLEIAVDGRKVRARVNDGPLVVEHEFDQPVKGRLGLWVKPDVATAFRGPIVSPSAGR